MTDLCTFTIAREGRENKIIHITKTWALGVGVAVLVGLGGIMAGGYRLYQVSFDEQELNNFRQDYALYNEKLAKLAEDNDKMQKELSQVANLEAQVRELLKKDDKQVSRGQIDRVSQELDNAGQGGASTASKLDIMAAQNNLTEKRIAYKRENLSNMLQQLSGMDNSEYGWPITEGGEISSYYGFRVDPFGGKYGDFHPGVDIAAAYGTPIHAAAAGIVEMAGWNGGYGQYVKLKHGDGHETAYGHMSAIAATAGQQVQKGDVIGFVGSTGASTGPHVHFEVLTDGEQTNPLQYVQAR